MSAFYFPAAPGGHALECVVCRAQFAHAQHLMQHLAVHVQLPAGMVQQHAALGVMPPVPAVLPLAVQQCPLCAAVVPAAMGMQAHIEAVHGVSAREAAAVSAMTAGAVGLVTAALSPSGSLKRPRELSSQRNFPFSSAGGVVSDPGKRVCLDARTAALVGPIPLSQSAPGVMVPMSMSMPMRATVVTGATMARPVVASPSVPAAHEVAVAAADVVHPCSMCAKVFGNKASLDAHKREHPEFSRPYACSHCNRRFDTKSHLRDHEHVHSATKTFSCALCPARFRQKSGLRRHMKDHQSGKVAPVTLAGAASTASTAAGASASASSLPSAAAATPPAASTGTGECENPGAVVVPNPPSPHTAPSPSSSTVSAPAAASDSSESPSSSSSSSSSSDSPVSTSSLS